MVGEMSEPKISGGYIIISRKIVESEIWDKPPLYLKVWIYLLTKAQHSNYKQLKRGQLFTSIPEIIEACSWKVGYRTEKPTKDQIYQIIDWLRKGNERVNEGETKATMITTTKATQGMLINIDNYCFYQTSHNYESNDEGNNEEDTRATRKQRQPNNINKNDKNVKNDKNEKDNIPFSEIIKYLNEKTGKNFSSKSAANRKLISARFNEERTLEDFIHVIDVKCQEWLNNDEMNKFLQPGTLFGNKFEKYLNEGIKRQVKQTDIRSKEIEFQRWVAAGKDPNKFNWS